MYFFLFIKLVLVNLCGQRVGNWCWLLCFC